jgi:hypothetical protein
MTPIQAEFLASISNLEAAADARALSADQCALPIALSGYPSMLHKIWEVSVAEERYL